MEQLAPGVAQEALELGGGPEQTTGPIQFLDPVGQVSEQCEQLFLARPAVDFVVVAHGFRSGVLRRVGAAPANGEDPEI
jgi:hypothetical protein